MGSFLRIELQMNAMGELFKRHIKILFTAEWQRSQRTLEIIYSPLNASLKQNNIKVNQ